MFEIIVPISYMYSCKLFYEICGTSYISFCKEAYDFVVNDMKTNGTKLIIKITAYNELKERSQTVIREIDIDNVKLHDEDFVRSISDNNEKIKIILVFTSKKSFIRAKLLLK